MSRSHRDMGGNEQPSPSSLLLVLASHLAPTDWVPHPCRGLIATWVGMNNLPHPAFCRCLFPLPARNRASQKRKRGSRKAPPTRESVLSFYSLFPTPYSLLLAHRRLGKFPHHSQQQPPVALAQMCRVPLHLCQKPYLVLTQVQRRHLLRHHLFGKKLRQL